MNYKFDLLLLHFEKRVCNRLTKLSSTVSSLELENRRMLVILRRTSLGENNESVVYELYKLLMTKRYLVRFISGFWSGSLTVASSRAKRGVIAGTIKLIWTSLSELERSSIMSKHRRRKCIKAVTSLGSFFLFLRTGRDLRNSLNAALRALSNDFIPPSDRSSISIDSYKR